MAQLVLTYEEVQNEIAEFLGMDEDPVDKDLRKINEIINRGYRNFLYPINQEKRTPHKWSFLDKDATIVTVSDQWIYTLPSDFSHITMGFKHDENTGYPPLTFIPEAAIMQKRASSDITLYPIYFAIRQGRYDKELGQQYEVLFHSVPNMDYTLHYKYRIKPVKLVNASDVFVGGDFASEVILECCLAVAEQKYEKKIGIHSALSEKRLQELIKHDNSTVPDTVGINRDTNIKWGRTERPLPTIEDSVYE